MLKFVLFVAALIWTIVVLYLCLLKQSSVPVITIPYIDKYVHAFFHFVFVLIWFFYFRKQLESDIVRKPLLYAFFFSFLFGIAIEILQGLYTKTRNGDIFDVMANLTGAVLAAFVININHRKTSAFD